jgi:recombination protein RecA
VVKNKVAAPFRTAEFDILYNEGISRVGDLLDLATGMEIITKRGSFFSYGELRLGQGRENAKDFLKQNPDLIDEIELAVRRNAAENDTAFAFGSMEDDAGMEDEEM